MILIYTPKITNRIRFIFNLIFRDLLHVKFNITNKTSEFRSYEGPKINYSYNALGDELFFFAHNLLFETGIKQQDISFVSFDGIKCPFAGFKNSLLPFDPFAAAFYLTTRYEEYLPYKRDKYDRFNSSESMALRMGFLKKPVVNIWAETIAGFIIRRYPNFIFPKRKYSFIPTIDIDSAWAYRQKGFVRSVMGYLKSLFALDFPEIAERTKVLSGLNNDPFDTFDFQFDLHQKYNLKPIYFILFAQYAQYDKNIHVFNKGFQSLIKSIADYAEVGIHPSFASNKAPKKLFKEIQLLSNVLNREVTRSRQHFLKLSFPCTYRNLIEADILEDYSMGYAAETGFRAGICDPFHFYDIDLETETNLKLFPFALMEGTLRDYHNISALDAIKHIKPIIDEIKAVNGTFISLWHNESLSNQKRWIGWHKVYEEMIKLALP
ncbi:MAG: hypothetical protein HGB12_05800 [Bacteroidetes bacterium]|nr:hypothetical protein [Bacteroidota bacterium]